MGPAIFNFPVHRKGDTFKGISFTMTTESGPMDLTSAIIRAQVRPKNDQASIAWEWTSEDSTIVVTGDDDNVINLQPRSATLMAGEDSGTYLYDLQVTFPDGTVTTFIQGSFIIIEDITK